MTPLMSFWPEIYDKISSQIKLIEYRRNFPKNCTYAYMYISSPVKAICGIIHFGKIHSLSDWKDEYANDSEVLSRINDYSSYRFGAEVTGFQKIEPISLTDLRNNIPGFVAPQSYILLENNPLLSEYLTQNTILVGEQTINDLVHIFPEHICKKY